MATCFRSAWASVFATSTLASVVSNATATVVGFHGFGTLQGSSLPFSPASVSADGTVVAGAVTAQNSSQAAYWTPVSGLQSMGSLSSTFAESFATGVSGNGQFIVGVSRSASNVPQATRTPVGSPVQTLYGPSPSGFQNFARAVSSDGSVVVGFEETAGGRIAFRWTVSGGRQYLGTAVAPSYDFTANAVSGDGSVVAGRRDTVSPPTGLAYRWTSSTGIVVLPDVPGGEQLAEARGISADGSTIVGAGNDLHQVAVRWDAAGNVHSLGYLPGGLLSIAFAASGDGSVIVGQSQGSGFSTTGGFIWDSGGMHTATDFLAARGVATPGWQLTSVAAVSADGKTFVGSGVNPNGTVEGWIATVPAPGACSLLTIGAICAARRRRPR